MCASKACSRTWEYSVRSTSAVHSLGMLPPAEGRPRAPRPGAARLPRPRPRPPRGGPRPGGSGWGLGLRPMAARREERRHWEQRMWPLHGKWGTGEELGRSSGQIQCERKRRMSVRFC
jgi:hypothetical protein